MEKRKKKWKVKKSEFGSGTLWKYAQTVGPAYLGAPTHPGKKKKLKNIQKSDENKTSNFVIGAELLDYRHYQIIYQNNLLILVDGIYLKKH